MKCPHCSTSIKNNTSHCPKCGRQIVAKNTNQTQPAQTLPLQNYQINPQQQTTHKIPANYEPISAGAYLGYLILFSIPVVGLILLIVFALSDDNINRRNFARACLWELIIAIVIMVIFGLSILRLADDIFKIL